MIRRRTCAPPACRSSRRGVALGRRARACSRSIAARTASKRSLAQLVGAAARRRPRARGDRRLGVLRPPGVRAALDLAPARRAAPARSSSACSRRSSASARAPRRGGRPGRAPGSARRPRAGSRARWSPGRGARSRCRPRAPRPGSTRSTRRRARSPWRSSATKPTTSPISADEHQPADDEREPAAERHAARRAISSRAASSRSGPPLRSSARSTTRRTSSCGSSARRAARRGHDARRGPPRPAAGAVAGAAVGQAVGEQQQRPLAREARPRRPATSRARARRAAGRAGRARAPRAPPPVSSSGGGCPASRSVAPLARRVERDHAQRREDLAGVALDARARPAGGRAAPRAGPRRARACARRCAGETPSAASSGPWPLTSPTTAWTVPPGVCTASKKSPPRSARRRPGLVVRGERERAGRSRAARAAGRARAARSRAPRAARSRAAAGSARPGGARPRSGASGRAATPLVEPLIR